MSGKSLPGVILRLSRSWSAWSMREACDHLIESRQDRIFLDDGQRILAEYRSHCSHSGQPGAGDAFFKWLGDNQGNACHFREVPLTEHEGREFVAVVVASNEKPPVFNASDTDWWDYRDAFERNDIRVIFLCG